jgi:outer membrane autotransporter protein
VSDDWHLGFSLGYDHVSTRSDRPGTSGDGDAADLGLSVQHVRGPWTFGGAVDLGYGSYDRQRTVQIGSLSEQLAGSPDVLTASGRVRVAYELPFQDWYVRPFVDLDLIYSHVPGYTERGGGGLALEVDGQDHASLELSPMLEIGGRFELGSWTVRPFAAAGATIPSNSEWKTSASLSGAPQGSGSFSTVQEMPDVLGNLDIGLQLHAAAGFELRLDYRLQAGEDYVSQYGGGRVAYRF